MRSASYGSHDGAALPARNGFGAAAPRLRRSARTFASLDFASSFFLVFVLTSIVAKTLVTVVLRKQGFAGMPYYNGLTYAVVGGFALLSALVTLQRGRLFVPPFALAVIMAFMASFVIGAMAGNSRTYIISWSIYFVVGLAAYLAAVSNRKTISLLDVATSDGVMLIAFITSVASLFLEVGRVGYVMSIWLLLAAVAKRRPLTLLAALAIFVLAHFVTKGGGIQPLVSRAGLLCVAAGLLFSGVYFRRWGAVAVCLGMVASAWVLAVSLDARIIASLPRNVAEGAQLLRGDDVRQHVATYQRFYEMEVVQSDIDNSEGVMRVFGLGLGRTINMTAAPDLATIGSASLAGAESVNNIHFINAAIQHKFGWVGLVLYALLIGYVMVKTAIDVVSGTGTVERYLALLYIVLVIAYSASASNFFFSDPFWPACLGLLAAHQRRHMVPAARPGLRGRPALVRR